MTVPGTKNGLDDANANVRRLRGRRKRKKNGLRDVDKGFPKHLASSVLV